MKKILSLTTLALVMLAGCGSGAPRGDVTEAEAVATARCITDKGAKMYGAFWCPHCEQQKKNFGKTAESYILYNECDARGENPVTEECLELDIQSYPTWIFPDGSRTSGALSLAELRERSGCSEQDLEQYSLSESA